MGLLCLPSVQSRDTGDHPDRKVHLWGAWTYSMDFFPSLGLCPFGDFLETIFGWRVMLQRSLGACAWCGCVCRQVLCREGEKDGHLPWKPFVHIRISSVPSSFFHTSWRLLGIQSLGGPCACRTCSSPVDCAEPGAAWVFLVVVVRCPCQGDTGTNEEPFSIGFYLFSFNSLYGFHVSLSTCMFNCGR